MRTLYFIKSLTSALLLLMCVSAKSQSLANYTSVRNTGVSYSSISGSGSSVSNWRNITSFTEDDNRSDFINIGFDFWYFGVRYTQFSVSSNGYIDFSTSTDDGGQLADDFGYENNSFTNTSPALGTWPAIAAFYDDLTAKGPSASLANSVKYALSGTAPNRTLTVEWINMCAPTNTTSSLNFQVKLVESTGQVLVNYSTMNDGGFTFSYSMGMNVDGNPTPARLKMLQAVNANSFSNNQANNLNIMPAANSQYVLSPPIPSAAPGSLTFSSLTSGGMTLNWSNLATNEVGYVIYNSTDAVNYSFVTQTAQNATSSTIAGLNPNTTYYWRVYAVTEGCLSAALSGTQATLPGQNKISVASGFWGTAATWSPSGVPTPGDNATISNGNTVSIDVNATCNMLTVGTGGVATLQYTGSSPRSLNTYSTVTINSGASFNVNTSSNVTHSLVIRGNVINNGTLNMAPDGNSLCNTTVTAATSKTLSGTGATTRFNNLRVNVGTSASDILEISTPSFTAPVNFLIIDNGTFKLSVANAATLTPVTAAATLGQKTGFWLNSPNVTVNTGAGVSVSGSLTLSSGTINVGNAGDEDITVNGGSVTIGGGALNVAGKFFTPASSANCYYIQTGGTLTVPGFGSTNTVHAPFQITGSSSSFNVSGGVIAIIREGGSGAQDLGMINTGAVSGSVTGGTLQIGNFTTSGSQTITINTNKPIGSLRVNSANATAKLLTNSVTVLSDVTITAGSFNANNLNVTLGGNWTNTGNTFTPGISVVTFSSNAAQSVSRTGGETFNTLLFTGSGTKTFGSNISATGNFSINTGTSLDVSSSNYTLNVGGNFINNGSFNQRQGLVQLNGTAAQSIGGSSISSFHNLGLSNTAGATLNTDANLIGALTLSNGTFNTNSKIFTMVSTATATARIAEITGTGDITGNVIVQRFAPGGTTGWAFLGTPLSSGLTLNDWDDDIFISCSTCPDGSAGGFISVYTYDETAPGLLDDAAAYIPMNTINDVIAPGKGYWVYLGTGSVSTTPITLDVTGAVRKFNYTIPLNYTNYGSSANDGWNLIHNPYPSPIKWSALKGATANIDNAIYVYNADLAAYASCVNGVSSPAIGSGGISDTIPMCQGFYVHSTGATGLNAIESNKVGGNSTFLKMTGTNATASSNPLIRLYLDQGGYRNETVLYLQSGATDGFDADYDAYKLPGNDPSAAIIATEKNSKIFQINGVAPISGNFSIPLKALTGYAGTYTISADNISSFPAGACITLYDKFTGISTNLKTSKYTFNLADTTTVARFNLNITLNPLVITSNNSQPNCSSPSSGEITAKGLSAGPWNYYWKDSGGNAVKTTLNKASTDTLKNLSGGTIYLEVNTVGMCDNNSTSFVVNPVSVPLAQFSCADTVDLGMGGIANFANASVNAISYLWDFGDGSANSGSFSPNHTYSSAGVYTVSLICNSGTGCSDTSYKQIIVMDKFVGIATLNKDNSDLIVKTVDENEFLIQGKVEGEKRVKLKMIDAFGKQVADYGESRPDHINLHLNLNHLSSGIYILNISGEDGKTVVKLPVR